MNSMTECFFCQADQKDSVWSGEHFSVVRTSHPDIPAYYQIVARVHVHELSELDADQRVQLLGLLLTIEQVLMRLLQPSTINTAKFGNYVNHFHWHIMARFSWDRFYPESAWGKPQRRVDLEMMSALHAKIDTLDGHVLDALNQFTGTQP